MKTLSEIENSYHSGAYNGPLRPVKHFIPEDGVVDENKSVKWNREEVARLKELNLSELREWRQAVVAAEASMRNEVASAMAYEFGISKEIASIMESHTFENEHSCMSDYFGRLSENAELAKKIIAAHSNEALLH